MPNFFILALRHGWRDWRNPELRILALALLVAVTAVSAVGFFASRIERAMKLQAAEMLGGDVRVSAATPLPTAWIEYAQQLGLRAANTLNFSSIVLQGDKTLLVAVKAVDTQYPLRGQLRIADSVADATGMVTTDVPASGTVWVEARILNELGLSVGSHLELGESTLQITKVLTHEPDQSGQFFQLAPRLLMNLDDVAKTQLIGVGSRVRYHSLLAGDWDKITHYREWLQKQVQAGQFIETTANARPELRTALERAQQFLGLATMVTVLLAGAAVAVASYHFSQKQADASAILRCLGVTQTVILRMYLLRLLFLGVLTSGLGCAFGWLAQYGLATLLASYIVTTALPAPALTPILQGVTTNFVTLLGFALPPVLRIQNVPPLRVLRRELGFPAPRVWQIASVAGIAMSALLFWQANNSQLALYVIGGTLTTILVLLAVAYGLVRSIRATTRLTWRFGLTNLARRATLSSLQLVAFGLGIMALLLLAVVRVDLLQAWQTSLPEETPNYFLTNIQAKQVDSLRARLQTLTHSERPLYPLVISRLIAINGQPVSATQYTSSRAKHLVKRDFNLSTSQALPADNRIIAGHFWGESTEQLSIEEGFAKEMGIQLGDKLQFRVANQEIIATVTSLRKVKWDSFNVNFFVLASPDVLSELPATYVTSVYLQDTASGLISTLVHEFPNMLVFDVNVIMEQVRDLINRAALAVQYVFLFTLLAGLIVLYAATIASHEERLYESALLRTLGATRYQILTGLIAEFATLGALAGLLAAIMASGLGYFLAAHLLDLPYHFNLGLWFISVVGGTIGVSFAGLLGTWSVLSTPPLLVLRRIDP
ncbi:MAG: ABC transporter permease [Beggiatoa sp. IS2]|nr:MAG: ABC transporter permease [Beggiatoa sp. IS2]